MQHLHGEPRPESRPSPSPGTSLAAGVTQTRPVIMPCTALMTERRPKTKLSRRSHTRRLVAVQRCAAVEPRPPHPQQQPRSGEREQDVVRRERLPLLLRPRTDLSMMHGSITITLKPSMAAIEQLVVVRAGEAPAREEARLVEAGEVRAADERVRARRRTTCGRPRRTSRRSSTAAKTYEAVWFVHKVCQRLPPLMLDKFNQISLLFDS